MELYFRFSYFKEMLEGKYKTLYKAVQFEIKKTEHVKNKSNCEFTVIDFIKSGFLTLIKISL